MKTDDIMKWSRAIADACIKTTIKPEDVAEACMVYVAAMNGKQTNYQKYFGTPEKTARMLITTSVVSDGMPIAVYCDGTRVASFGTAFMCNDEAEMREKFTEWLKQEAD